ncbi:membrane protein insertase YidC [Propionibacterium sp.]|uniref:membrane protein insertase YidC n=1 Tax=Propionibacterium sp. TaxID=1977903 RepID=UPI0039EC10E8
MLTLMNIGDSLGSIGTSIMEPLYWAVSGLIVLFHAALSSFMAPDSGWTWTLSIVMLTCFIRLVMMPLYAKQLNSSRAMQTLQPKIQELQKKYGADRERLGQETMKLYKEEGVNPASSCAPLLIQLPIFFALYRVLSSASTGHNVHGFWLQRDPQLVDSLSHAHIFGAQLSGTFMPINNGFGPTQILATILILLMTAFMFIQQLHMLKRNMPPSAFTGPMAQQQKMMLYLFPAMYLFMGLAIPIGVLIYWLTTNLWTMGQQYFIIRNYPTPGTPAYVEWEERMKAQGKNPKAIEAHWSSRARKAKVSEVATVAATDEAHNPVVARQSTSRQTVKHDQNGNRQVVRRQQPSKKSRATRKRK